VSAWLAKAGGRPLVTRRADQKKAITEVFSSGVNGKRLRLVSRWFKRSMCSTLQMVSPFFYLLNNG
jgi:hypothetical protein